MPSFRFGRVGLLSVLLLGSLRLFAAPAADLLTVHLGVRDGYLAVAPDQVRLELSEAFRNQIYPSVPKADRDARVQAELTRYLDGLLRSRGRLVEQLLGVDADPLPKNKRPPRQVFEGLDRTNSTWAGAVPAFSDWRKRHRDIAVATIEDVFRSLLRGGELDDRYADGPLSPVLAKADDDDGSIQGIRQCLMQGRLQFRIVAAPVTTNYVSARAFRATANLSEFDFTRPASRPRPSSTMTDTNAANPRLTLGSRIGGADLSRTIRSEAGSLWYRDHISEPLADYLEMRGHTVVSYDPDSENLARNREPETEVGVAPGRPELQPDGSVAHQRILVSPDPELVGVLFRIPTNRLDLLRMALYLVLPTPDYDRLPADLFGSGWLATAVDPFASSEVPTNRVPNSTNVAIPIGHLDLAHGPGSSLSLAGRHVSRRFLAERTRQLGVAGLTASVINRTPAAGTNRHKTIELLVAPDRASATAKTNPPAAGSQPLTFDRGTNFLSRDTFAAESSARDRAEASPTFEPEHPNFLRVGLERSPGRDLRYYVGYTRIGVAANDALGAQLGFQKETLGEVSYHRDFVGLAALGKRLGITLTGVSDFEPERKVDGVAFDERRSGGTARFDLELLRDWHSHWLSSSLSLGYRETTARDDDRTLGRDGIGTVDLGLLYLRPWDATPTSARLEIEPMLRAGYSDTNGASFFRPKVDATYHQFLGSFQQLDINGSAAWATSDTPPNELPSFGGEHSVRGYRVDAGVGRMTWSIQSEAWIPLRFRTGASDSLDRILRRNLAVAGFVDLGGVEDTLDDFQGLKAGAGVGLRLVWGDVLTVHLDWAHALGESDDRRGGSMFYFTVTTRRGF